MSITKSQYQAVSLVEKKPWDDDYGSSSDFEEVSLSHERTSRSQWSRTWIWLLHVLLLSVSAAMFIGSFRTRPSTMDFVQQYSAWSPAAEAVEYHSVQYNVTTKGNRFVGKGPEVDRAWHEICYDMGDQMITPDQLKTLGMPETSIQVNNPKTGEPGYRIGLEVFHQLHCLNLLRKITHKDYYTELGMLGEGEALSDHAAHCIEVLRLNLQCQSDVGPFTLYLKEGDPLAWPELNTQHTCRNFDRIKEWAMVNSVGIMENA